MLNLSLGTRALQAEVHDPFLKFPDGTKLTLIEGFSFSKLRDLEVSDDNKSVFTRKCCEILNKNGGGLVYVYLSHYKGLSIGAKMADIDSSATPGTFLDKHILWASRQMKKRMEGIFISLAGGNNYKPNFNVKEDAWSTISGMRCRILTGFQIDARGTKLWSAAASMLVGDTLFELVSVPQSFGDKAPNGSKSIEVLFKSVNGP